MSSTSSSSASKKTEAQPLLGSPAQEAQYSTTVGERSPTSSSSDPFVTHSAHMALNEDRIDGSIQQAKVDGGSRARDTLEAYRIEEDEESDEVSLLASRTLVVTRTQVQNIILLNVLAFVFVFANMTLNLTVLSIIHERIPMQEPHLPDILFDILPDVRRFLDVTEYYIVIQMSSVFVMLFFHRHRSVIFRRLCIVMGLIYFFRAICMASTQLPLASRNYTCSPQLKNMTATANITSLEFIGIIASRVFYMSLGMGLSINGHHSYCGDYIFSGHTVMLVLTFLFFQEYFLPARKTLAWRIVYLGQWTLTAVSIVCVVIARGHYFIDIIIAYFVTTRIFWIYHTLCQCNSQNYTAMTSYFNRLWWFRLFLYFENVRFARDGYHAVGGKLEEVQQVQRVFEYPLPWPKQLGTRRKHRNQFMA